MACLVPQINPWPVSSPKSTHGLSRPPNQPIAYLVPQINPWPVSSPKSTHGLSRPPNQPIAYLIPQINPWPVSSPKSTHGLSRPPNQPMACLVPQINPWPISSPKSTHGLSRPPNQPMACLVPQVGLQCFTLINYWYSVLCIKYYGVFILLAHQSVSYIYTNTSIKSLINTPSLEHHMKRAVQLHVHACDGGY